jgi:hypothetical protein
MANFIIRNDDVNYDTDLDNLKCFCDICDKYGFQIIQAITPAGECKKVNAKMNNDQIKKASNKLFEENFDLIDYIHDRLWRTFPFDFIGVHGLYHTHEPEIVEIKIAKSILEGHDLPPKYFIPPFNEGNYGKEVEGLIVSKLDLRKGERLEDFLKEGIPTAPIVYCHSWRFGDWYSWESLEECLKRCSS